MVILSLVKQLLLLLPYKNFCSSFKMERITERIGMRGKEKTEIIIKVSAEISIGTSLSYFVMLGVK